MCNFTKYLKLFAKFHKAEIRGVEREMQAVSADGLTLVKFGMGASQAATICDLLSAITPKSCLFLGKCGSLKHGVNVGEFVLPIAGIRGEGASDSYMPPEVPALPSFAIQKTCSSVVSQRHRDYYTGTVFTTSRRVWEHDHEFKERLSRSRAIAIDMETATLFTCAFANRIPMGALLLVSDQPMTPEGVKTRASDVKVDGDHLLDHLKIGCDTLKEIRHADTPVKHLIF